MKKAFIFSILFKSSLAINLFPFQNDSSNSSLYLEHNLNLDKLLNTNSCPNYKALKIASKNLQLMVNSSCYNYNINLLMSSASSFALNQGLKLLTNNLSISRNISKCDMDKVVANAQPKTKAVFLAKIALAVFDSDRKYKILISNFSGQNVQAIVISKAPITSLSWNKDSNSIAYVSYEDGKPVIYIQNIYTAQRYIVSNFSGSNSSPAFAGDSLLVSLSKDYGTHIYKIDLSKYNPRKTATPIITTGSIDTEADYANGNLIFTSNQNGKPEIYLKQKGSAQIRPISVGRNNFTGRISNAGSKVLYVYGNRGLYNLMYHNLKTKTTRLIDSGKILSASFAPDDELIAYIKNNTIVFSNLNYGNTVTLANLKYKEVFDVKWSIK